MFENKRREFVILLTKERNAKVNKCQFQNFKNGLSLSQFSSFSVDCGCFPRGLLPVFGVMAPGASTPW